MNFRMHIKPIDFESDSLEEANDICEEVLHEANLEITIIEEV